MPAAETFVQIPQISRWERHLSDLKTHHPGTFPALSGILIERASKKGEG